MSPQSRPAWNIFQILQFLLSKELHVRLAFIIDVPRAFPEIFTSFKIKLTPGHLMGIPASLQHTI